MLRTWCKTNQFFNNTNLSHVLMDGGKLSIPFDKLENFYKIYVESINLKQKVFVVEQKTPTYNFFVDVDYKNEEPLPEEESKKIIKIICNKTFTFGAKRAIISISVPKINKDLIKSGIHINFPGLVVDQKSAIEIRRHIINELTIHMIHEDWENIIDLSVYKGSGLRLPWSHKKVKDSIEEPYLPIFEFDGEFKKINKTKIEILKDCTLRVENELCQLCIEEAPKIKKQEGGFSKEEIKNEIKNLNAIAHIQTFIRKNFKGQEHAQIFKIFKNKDSYLLSTDSRYCDNIKREHKSNHVWFLITNDSTIVQKCFCTCETIKDRKNGYCKDFTSDSYTINDDIKYELFPDKKPVEIQRDVYNTNNNSGIHYSNLVLPKSKQSTGPKLKKSKKRST